MTMPPSNEVDQEECTYDDDDDDAIEPQCTNCGGDGRDPWNDYCTPCVTCGGDG